MLLSSFDPQKALENAPTELGAFKGIDAEIEPYFQDDGYISRSKLLRLSAMLAGKEPKEFGGAYEGGRTFDDYFTNRANFKGASPWMLMQLFKAQSALLNYAGQNEIFAKIVAGQVPAGAKVRMQHEVYRNAFQAGAHSVKAKIKSDYDVQIGSQKVCIDLKSTTKQSMSEFLKDIVAHQLDLQDVWYKDVGQYDRFVIVAVSYHNEHAAEKALDNVMIRQELLAPAKVFVVELSALTLEKARNRYVSIIEQAAQKGLLNTNA